MTSYVNFTLKGADSAAVAAALKALGRKGFVAPTCDGVTVFYDREADSQDTPAIGHVAGVISKALGKPVLAAFNDEDERLDLWLFMEGALADHYSSGEEKPIGGNADKLVAAIGADADTAEVESVLRAKSDAGDGADSEEEVDDEVFAFAMDRHVALADALGLPAELVTVGFANVAAGDDIPDRDKFVEV